jgi:hypothetical protein
MKDIVTPVPPEEVRGMIKKCLETAALLNYTRLSSEAKIEGEWLVTSSRTINYFNVPAEDLRGETLVPPSKKLDDLIHLAELCVDLLQQNEEHYAEVSVVFYSPCITKKKIESCNYEASQNRAKSIPPYLIDMQAIIDFSVGLFKFGLDVAYLLPL